MNQLIVQTLAYFIVFVLAFAIISLLLKGFFWSFIRVKMSMGEKVLVKVREINRDCYAVGSITEGELKYKLKGEKKTISLPENKKIFYRTLGISVIDVDSKKNAICTVDYEAVVGFDAVKQEQLLVRALEKPTIADNKEKLMFLLLIVIAIACAFLIYNVITMSEQITTIKTTIGTLSKGLITATG